MILNTIIDDLLIVNNSRVTRNILHNVRFSLENGSICTIIGKNGSGKSTLAKAIGRLLDERFYTVKGEILLDKRDILKMPPSDLISLRKKTIRYVFQDSINSFDPLRKLKYYFDLLNPSVEDVSGILEYFRLPDFGTLSGLYPYEASAGMLQRVSFVLALLSRPELLILDEPTSSLDAPVINLFMLKLKEFIIENNSAVLLITQDIDLAYKISDKIYTLENGTLLQSEATKLFDLNEHGFVQ